MIVCLYSILVMYQLFLLGYAWIIIGMQFKI